MKNLKFIFLIIILSSLFLFPVFVEADLVPCGGPGEPPCQLCHLFVMLDRIIDFVLIYIVFPVATLLLVIGGAMFMFSAENQNNLAKGKLIMTSVMIGLVIIFSAWLLIGLFLSAIGLSQAGIGLISPDKWFIIDCPVGIVQPEPKPKPEPEPEPEPLPPLARLSLKSFQGDHDCDDPRFVLKCCPEGYRMCTSEMLRKHIRGRRIYEGDKKTGALGWVDKGNRYGCREDNNCGNWTSKGAWLDGCILGSFYPPPDPDTERSCNRQYPVWCCLNGIEPDPQVPPGIPEGGRHVFITEHFVFKGNLGGLEGANAKCQAAADNAGLTGNYRAWISTTYKNAKDNVLTGDHSYWIAETVERGNWDGPVIWTKIATNNADLLDGSLLNRIDRNERGNSGLGRAWTGTTIYGELVANGLNCHDWTIGNGVTDYRGVHGSPFYFDDKWDNEWTENQDMGCHGSARLYCFQQ